MRFADRLSLCILLAACGGDRKKIPPPVDSGTDSGPVVDAAPDTGPDASDASSDAGDAGDADAGVDSGPELKGYGEPCEFGDECESGICLVEDRWGMCTEPCAHDPDCAALDAVCLVLPQDADHDGTPDGFALGCGAPMEPGYSVGNLCEEHSDCRNRRCDSNICRAVCVDASDCTVGMECVAVPVGFVEGTYPGCGFEPLEGDVRIDEIDLGVQTIPRDGALGGIVGVAVAPDAISLTVNSAQTDEDEPLTLGFTAVRDPDLDLLLDVAELVRGEDQDLRCFPWLHVAAMMIPNSTVDRIEFQTGLYSWRNVSTPAVEGGPWPEIDTALTAYVKRTAAPPEGGTLDLNIFLVDIGVNAAAAPGNARIQNALAAIETTYGQAGIDLGDIAYLDVVGDDAGRLAVIDSIRGFDSELSQLFRLSEGREGFVVNVFLVRRIAGSILGVAGGIPGPVALHGTIHSGVVVEGEVGILNAEQLGQVTAHEIGHYLGLFHPTENPGEDPLYDGDPIADTALGDADNLMHWAARLARPNTELTEGQGFVMLRNPNVQ